MFRTVQNKTKAPHSKFTLCKYSCKSEQQKEMKNKTYCSLQNTTSIKLLVKHLNCSLIVKRCSAVIKLSTAWKPRTSKDKENSSLPQLLVLTGSVKRTPFSAQQQLANLMPKGHSLLQTFLLAGHYENLSHWFDTWFIAQERINHCGQYNCNYLNHAGLSLPKNINYN